MTHQPPVAAAVAPRPRVPLWLLALLTFSGTLAMHVFVPALPLAGQDLGAGPGAMRMTISLYILGLAVGQLVYGPLADRYGRRPVLMVGLTLYAVSGLAAVLAPGVQALIAARLFQALGGCAGLVLGRAIVRDLAGPQEAAQRLALMNLMVTLGPGLAPLLGTALAELAGWRSIFVLLCALGVVNFLFTWRMLPETGQRTVQSGATLARNTLRLVRSPVFLGYAVGGGCATTSMYAFVASAPFIFTDRLHRPAHEVGLYLAVLISGVWLGSMLASRLMARRLPIARVLVWANLVSVLGAFVFLGMVLSGRLSVFWTILPMFVFTLGAGVASPAALTQAISVDPQVIGSASGLYGFTQMAVGAICTALAGLGQDPALAAALVLAGAGVLSQLGFWVALRPGQTSRQRAV